MHFALCTLDLALVLAAACTVPSLAGRVRSGDFAAVREGRYEGTLRIRNGDPGFEKIAAPWRRELEDEPGLLRQVGEKYFSIPAGSEFRYMYVAEDSVAKNVVLRYFAPDPRPVIYAGWQLMFVFYEPRRAMVRVYASEVPLE